MISITSLTKKLKREVLELKIRCSNKGGGCEWTGELENLEKHLKSENGCGFVDVGCSNEECKEIMMRKGLKKHLETSCDYRLVICKFCKEKGTYIYTTKVHMPVCENYPLHCPNVCGEDRIQRKDMPTHREECPLEPIECPFKEAGCSVGIMVRKELEKHLTDRQQQHLLNVMGAYKEMKQDRKEMKVQLKETKEEVKKLQAITDFVTIDGQHIQHNEQFSEAAVKAIHSQLMSKRSNHITKAGSEHGILFCMPHKHYQGVWCSPYFYVYGQKMHLESDVCDMKLMASESRNKEKTLESLLVEITDCTNRNVSLHIFDLGERAKSFGELKKTTTTNLEILEEYLICKIFVSDYAYILTWIDT